MLRVPRQVGQGGKSVFRSLFGARSVLGMRRGFKIDVVEAAQNLARCFPELRPRGEEVIAFAEETAAMLGEDDFHVPPDLLAEGLACVELAERRRLVEHFAADQPTGWRRLVADLRANPVAAERALVCGAIKWLICEGRDRPRSVLAALEGGDPLPRTPGALVALVLEPSYLWSIVEAADVPAKVSSLVDDDVRWVEAAESIVRERVTQAHVDRVRTLLRPLETQLPVRSLQRASKALAADAQRVRRDADAAEVAAGLLLVGYAVRLRPEPLAVSPN